MHPRPFTTRSTRSALLSPRRAVRGAGPLAAAGLVAVLAACGSTPQTVDASASTITSTSTAQAQPSTATTAPYDSANPDTTINGTFPVTVKAANGSVTLATAPKKIVSLSPTATETLFAIGAGPQVVAVDDQSTFPASAPRTKLSGFQPNAEAVAGYRPDLVVVANDANGLMASLAKLNIPAMLMPAATTLDDAYAQDLALGQATGHPATAALLTRSTQSRIAAAIASVPAAAKGRKVYHELDPTFYSATSSTFIGSIYKEFGLTNIADAAKAVAGGYPQVSAEFVVTQAPDLIVLADTKCCQQDVAAVAKRPAFAAIPAVKNGKVLAADDDIASRWGPRIADFAEALAKMLQS